MQKRIVSLVIILIMMFALTSCDEGNSRPVVILGEKGWTYSNGDFNVFNSIQQTSDGGYIATGSTAPHNEPHHLWLVKIDSTGGKEWDKTFSISVDDYSEGHSVWQTNDGGYIIVGYTALPEIDDVGAWLIKTDSEGNRLWDKTVNHLASVLGTSNKRFDRIERGIAEAKDRELNIIAQETGQSKGYLTLAQDHFDDRPTPGKFHFKRSQRISVSKEDLGNRLALACN